VIGLWHRSPALRGWALIAPTLLILTVMLVIPLGMLVAQSFWTQTGLAIDRTPGLQNYALLVTLLDPDLKLVE